MCVHLYEILAFYIFNVTVGSKELSLPYRIDSIVLLSLNVYCLYCNYMVFKQRTALENQRIHEEELAVQMNIAPGA